MPDVRHASVLNLAAQYHPEKQHTKHVARLALEIWDELAAAGVHEGRADERELLWAAAVLHDIGTAVDYDDHHKHSRYLILNAGLPGYSPRETALIGQMARYHRKGEPGLREFAPLGAARRRGAARALRRGRCASPSSSSARATRPSATRTSPWRTAASARAAHARGHHGRPLGRRAPGRPVRARLRARAHRRRLTTASSRAAHGANCMTWWMPVGRFVYCMSQSGIGE